jgi:tRNA pseudouridine55 synthase
MGRATRLARYVTAMDKSYKATARFGAVSDTLDAEGEITPVEGPVPDETEIRSKLPDFTGRIFQIPPMASAVKVGGRRLYDLHRRGIEVDREPRPVEIEAFDLISVDPETSTADFEISCSSGTYVRSLISDLADALDSCAYLTALRRTRVGQLLVENASPPETLDGPAINKRIIQPNELLAGLPEVGVSADDRFAFCNGRKMEPFGVDGSYRVTVGGELLAVYRDEGHEARAEVVLCAP